jgi:hypothetical protein
VKGAVVCLAFGLFLLVTLDVARLSGSLILVAVWAAVGSFLVALAVRLFIIAAKKKEES